MGANAQTAVPAFTAGQVLTAAQQTQINTGIPVFATTTTRDAAFGGTGEKTLAEGQFAYIEASNTTQYYDGAAWQILGGGLQYISGTSFATATSVSLPTSSFTSTYRNYRLLFTITALTSNANFSARLRASGTDNTTSNYFTTLYGTNSAGSSAANASGSQSSWSFQSLVTTSPAYSFAIDIMSPEVAERTMLIGGFNSHDGTNSFARTGTWLFNATTQFDSFTFISDVASSISGSYRLYGYSEN